MLNTSITSCNMPQRKNRRQTRDTSNRVPFIVQFFLGAEKLHHVFHSLEHIIDDEEHIAKISPTPPLLAFKQVPNLKQTIVHSELPSLQDNFTTTLYNPVMATSASHMNGYRATIARQECSLPVAEHLSGQGHLVSDLWASVLKGGLQDRQQRRVAEQRLIVKIGIHEDGLNWDLGFMLHD
eukprot:g46882.t1